MTLDQRMKLHAEFMCAAMNNPNFCFAADESGAKGQQVAVKFAADAALVQYEERWKGEKEV